MKSFAVVSTLLFALVSAVPAAESSTNTLNGTPSLPFGKDPIPLYSLATSFPAPVVADAASIEAIRGTIALYLFAIDGQNFDALGEIFTNDVITNYSAPLNILTPLSNIKAALKQSLACVTTQHSAGTQLIQIKSLTTAFSVTYFRAMHFGKNKLTNEVAEAYGQYQDTWQRQSNGKWKIVYRNLVYMGPILGNLAIFADC